MQKTLLKAVNLNESCSSLGRNVHSVLVQLEDKSSYAMGVVDLRRIEGDIESFLELFVNQVERSVNAIAAKSNLQHRFEQIIQSVNEQIARAASENRWQFDAKDVNALIGLAGSGRLYLTGVGDLTALFLHKSEQQRYKVFNLFRGIQTEHHIPDWQKLFTVILDGDIASGDVFLVGNKEIPQQIDSDELHQILVTLPPLGATEKLRQYFPIPVDLSMVILKAEDATDLKAMEMNNAESSLNHFSRTKDTTSRMLEHQRPHKNDWIRATKNIIKFTANITISSINVALAVLMGVVKSLLRVIKLFAKSNKKQIWKAVSSNTIEKIARSKDRFRFPRHNKKLLIVILASVLLFAAVIVFAAVKKNIEREQAVYKEIVQEIEKVYDTASASIIYKDEEQAQKLLLDGVLSIENLPTNSESRRAKAGELKTQFEALLNDLRHTKKIEELELLASLPEGEEAVRMGADNETAYAITASGSVYQYKASSSNFENLNVQAPESFGTPIRSRYDDINDVLYLFDGRQIAKLDADQKLYELVDVTNLPADTIDIEYFARRIYSLSPSNEQVYRHERDGNGFGAPEGWIQARTISLQDSISISVDGSVWVLKQDGRVVRYQKGFEETWPRPIIDPAISPSTILWTTDLINNIYLIDKEQSRIIQIDKVKGVLKNQFTHEAFKDLKGVWEKDGSIFVLTQTGLYKFSIE